MPDPKNIELWKDTIHSRYKNYLKTSFYFKDKNLRASFQKALQEADVLLKGPFPEPGREFEKGTDTRALVQECFSEGENLFPALEQSSLYLHQGCAIRASYIERKNVIVATGTASGKTESFLYSILFELYRQHLAGELQEPGVRALILYPMNALANDQRKRLGEICKKLKASEFQLTFGQYTGQTPEDKNDKWRHASKYEDERELGELIFREEMRSNPPHILLTNYSMLEYLLIRPDDSPLFDNGRYWQFLVLDEAHQYRGTKGMEMGMLIRRLKQRLRDGGRKEPFSCIATSATMSSSGKLEDQRIVAKFASELFGEPFSESEVIFGHTQPTQDKQPSRYHIFLRALEGAFMVHENGKDTVVLNRKEGKTQNEAEAKPLEIALCTECGQHYYVGREENGKLREAVRDPSHPDFGVDYYLPLENEEICSEDKSVYVLCRGCGTLSQPTPGCSCRASVQVKKCDRDKNHADQLKRCESCGYRRGSFGDPVQEIVHGSDGPNAVIATSLHELLPEGKRQVLAFADSRQEAAFFAWYAQNSYEKFRDRNFLLRAIKMRSVDQEGLSITGLKNRLFEQFERANFFAQTDTDEDKRGEIWKSIFKEALTDEKRISLTGVGLVKWSVEIPDELKFLKPILSLPWNLDENEALKLLEHLLDEMRQKRAVSLPEGFIWDDRERPLCAYRRDKPQGQNNVREWGGQQSSLVKHFLCRLLDSSLSDEKRGVAATGLMKEIWEVIRDHDGNTPEDDRILLPGQLNGTFRLNSRRLRIKPVGTGEIWECDNCANLSTRNIRGICPRNGCSGSLVPVDQKHLKENHYRVLYESADLPPILRAEEHTAQIENEEARERQNRFMKGEINILSSSTTFEMGVDLGTLDVAFLRNVPPEPFNYTQRVGRVGRREQPGLALTYCRRNSHDLYHYEDPEKHVINGEVRPPRLQITNVKIIDRHIIAVALSAFFKENEDRFEDVGAFIKDWSNPHAVSDLNRFCHEDEALEESLRRIVPEQVHEKIGLTDKSWISRITDTENRFAKVEAEICEDYMVMRDRKTQIEHERPTRWQRKSEWLEKRMKTVRKEPTLNFLSRKAVIPKYGFPVDVVELDTHSQNSVSLQRDLSQAIAEYAPGSKVVANKLEWESYGIKQITDRACPVYCYDYDDARKFKQWEGSDCPPRTRKYLSPIFGFTTPLFEKPKELHRQTWRLYTTRPFFQGFGKGDAPKSRIVFDVQITEARPGTLVILCEGRNREGFWICRSCGAHNKEPVPKHKSPSGSQCPGTLERFSLGYELSTDVVRLQFPGLTDEWGAYSVAYAILLGASETLGVPATDLNVTITGSDKNEAAIVLYDNVPGGAGLVAQLEEKTVFADMLRNAQERVQGDCGCDSSCYGCLRSYRNQFAHPCLDRKQALKALDRALNLN